jgi:type II secretory pathway component PulM
MQEFLNRLSTREKTIVVVSALLLAGLGLHALVIEPYQQKQSSLVEQLEQGMIDLKWMHSVVQRLPASQLSVAAADFEGSLANLIDQEVRSLGLEDALAQMTPTGEDEIRVRFTSIAFNRLLNFIAQVNSQGLRVRDLRINSTDQRADVDASLVLEKDG